MDREISDVALGFDNLWIFSDTFRTETSKNKNYFMYCIKLLTLPPQWCERFDDCDNKQEFGKTWDTTSIYISSQFRASPACDCSVHDSLVSFLRKLYTDGKLLSCVQIGYALRVEAF